MVIDEINRQSPDVYPGLIAPSLTVHPLCPFPRKGSIPSPEGENHPGLQKRSPTRKRVPPGTERTRPNVVEGPVPSFGRRPTTVARHQLVCLGPLAAWIRCRSELVRQRRTYVWFHAEQADAELEKVPASLFQTYGVGSTNVIIGRGEFELFIFPIILPEAHFADVPVAAPWQRVIAAARTLKPGQ